MRAITVRQPWAWAIVHGGKDVENRTRNIAGAYRGPIAVHAGLTDADVVDTVSAGITLARLAWWDTNGQPKDRGAVIGVVDLVDVHPATPPEVEWCGCSDWAERFYVHHLVLANPRPLARPIPWRGALGLWTVPADLEAAIREQVDL